MTEDDLDLRHDVHAWLRSGQPIEDALAETLRVVSYPASLEQNDVLDLIDRIIGDRPNVTRRRWVPAWAELESFTSPLDSQRLCTSLLERDARYAETLPGIEAAVYTLGGGDGPVLMLNGHVDVVPVENQDWTADAFDPVVRDGRMIARGAMDMKAGLVAAAYAFAYLADRWEGRGTIHFAAVPEEETGGNGTLAVLHAGYVPDAVVFTEPTDLQVVHRHVGIQGFAVDVDGRPGGMLRRSWGSSAAPVLARAALALERLELDRTARAKTAGGYDEDDLPGFVNFTMTAGDWVATRAAHGHIEGLMGLLPGETQEEAGAELARAVQRATAGDDLRVDVRIRRGGHRGAELPVADPLVSAFAVPGAAGGAPGAPTAAGTMVCDAKIVQGGGWAPAIVVGPIGGGLHSADEWVDLESVTTLVDLIVRGSERFLRG